MPKVVVLPHEELCPEGKEIEVKVGATLCQSLLLHKVEIEHACEQSGACSTCHVIIREGYDSLVEPDEREEDLLDRAWGLEAESRMSCQVRVGEQDLVVEIPKYTRNHASERR